MLLDTYKEVARRCVLLACSLYSVKNVALMFKNQCGKLNRVVFWPGNKSSMQSHLLIEANSYEALVYGLNKIKKFRCIYGNVDESEQNATFFRLSSNPSLWSINHSKSIGLDIESLNADGIVVQKNLSNKKVLQNLLSCNSIEAQASLFVNSTDLSKSDIVSRFVLIDNIEELMSSIFPNIQVSLYGSFGSGLSSIYSDLDFSIGLKTNANLNKPESEFFPKFINNVKLNDSDYLKHYFLHFFKKLMCYLDPLGFKQSKLHLGYVPIFHLAKYSLLGISLDISRSIDFDVGRDVSNFDNGSQILSLFRLFAHCLPNFKHSIVCLKFIASRMNLTRPHSPLTNFKLTILFIHCLQLNDHIPPFKTLLPLMDEGMKNDDRFNFDMMDNHTFCDQFNVQPIPSLDLIFYRFITYILELNTKNSVLDLLLGKITTRSVYFDSFSNRLTELGFVCENDNRNEPNDYIFRHHITCPNPFNPASNILTGVDQHVWNNLITVCLFWKQCLDYHSKPTPSSCTQKWGLVAMSDPSFM